MNKPIFMGQKHLRLTSRTAEWLPALAGKSGSVLDIGCGKGELLRELRGQFSTCVGIESSLHLAEAARAKFSGDDAVKIHHGDVTTVPITDRFDVVLLLGVMHNIPDSGKRLAVLDASMRACDDLLLIRTDIREVRSDDRDSARNVYHRLLGRAPQASPLQWFSDLGRQHGFGWALFETDCDEPYDLMVMNRKRPL